MAERKSDLAFAAFFGGGKRGGGGGSVTSVNGKTGAVVLNAEDVGGAQESLKLTATPTAGPSETTLMSGTWSGATWEEVAAAIQASRLIQIDVANIGKITLLYNLGTSTTSTNAASNAFVYNVGGILYSVFVELLIDDGNNRFHLSIINANTKTINIYGTTPAIAPVANTIYNCGELASLTITDPGNIKYSVIFFSGATATTTVGIANFAAEPNKRYRIDVESGYATYDSWPYTPAP